jgi:predicted metal-dependent hydrolase
MHEYTLVRSNRKSIAIHIQPDASIEVRAPYNITSAKIQAFVQANRSWIMKQQSQVQAYHDKKMKFQLNYGDVVTVCGKECTITAMPGNQISYDERQFYLPPNLTPEQIKSACIQIYKQVARQILSHKTFYFAAQMGVMPQAVKINSAKTRWGSCSAKKKINYSWRLIMAEEAAIDYVVVHELAHLIEMNHSPRFWGIVAMVFSDYKQRQARLKILQQRLNSEDWE